MKSEMKYLDEILKVIGINLSVLFGTTIADAPTLIEWVFKIAVLAATLIYTIKKIRKIK